MLYEKSSEIPNGNNTNGVQVSFLMTLFFSYGGIYVILYLWYFGKYVLQTIYIFRKDQVLEMIEIL